jgi:hypothetical protein
MEKGNDFVAWARLMGYNGKQLAAAAASLGYSRRAELQNRAELDITLRLAMAARRAGLQPWSPETDAEIAAMMPTAADLWMTAADEVQARLREHANEMRKSATALRVIHSDLEKSRREVADVA